MKLPQRFWDKVTVGAPGDCWNWQGAKDHKGYGLFMFEGRVIRASRLIMLSRGGSKTSISMHTCDNSSCVNPAHILAGTPLLNVRDCIQKNRRAETIGKHNNNSKLSDQDVREIRASVKLLPTTKGGYCLDGSAQSVAKRYGITYRNLRMIVNRQTWKHIG